MPKLELLASGPGTGKTTYCIDLFRREILKSPGGLDSRSYFVLPNREHAGRIQNLVLKKGVPGLFNVHILTIQDLAERFSVVQPRPRPGESMRRILLSRILEDPEASWKYFSSVKDLAGFHALLSERIQELNSATMDIAELERRAQPLLKDAVFRAKFRDFSVVVKRYGEELEKRGLAEAEYSLETLSEAVTERAAAQLVILDGFYHFSQAQKVLILALAKRVERMVATLTLPESAEKRPHVFELVESTRRFLTRAGFKPSAAGFSKNRRAGNAALKHLEKNLFLPEAKALTSEQDAVRLMEAETPREEVEAIAREILRLHRETDWHFSDMAVILRSVQGYEKWIGPLFAEYGIPVHIHERGRTIQTGVGRFTHRLAGLFLSDWRDADLFSLLKSGYLPAPPDPEAAARFERLAYAKNTLSGRGAFLDLAKEAALPGVAETLDFLAEWQDAVSSVPSGRVFRRRWTERLRACCLQGEDGPALAAVEGLLQRAVKLYPPDAEFPAVHALEEFQRALETGLFSQKPAGKNRVQVYDAVMALPKEYRAVFVAGLLDQAFPKTAAEDALFKDDERETMNGRDSRLEERAARRAGERYFFYMAVTRARELVTLSFPKKDQDARPLLPSAFVEDVRRCFRLLPAAEEKTAGWRARGQAEREIAAALFSPPDAKTKKPVSALAAHWRTRKRFAGILEAGSRDLSGRLREARTLAALAEQATVLSATRLEVFLTCAFRYFAENEMKLKPYFEDRLRAEMGILLHAVLEDYYQGKGADASALLERLFAESPLANEPLYRQRFLLRRLRRTLERFLRAEKEDPERNALTPKHFELEFGKKSDGSAAAWPYLSFGKGGVKLGGKIDRIDLTPDGKALVIDYKLGKRNLNKKLKQGLEVQLPIYMMAVKRLLGLDILGAELRFLESGEKAGIEEAGAEDLMRETEKKIVEASSRMRGGDITVRSKDCQYCELDSLCRFEKWKQVYTEVDGA